MALAPGPVPDGPVPDGPVPDGPGPMALVRWPWSGLPLRSDSRSRCPIPWPVLAWPVLAWPVLAWPVLACPVLACPVADCRGPVPRFPHHGARIPGTDSGYENGGSLPFFNDSGRPGGLASAPALFRVNNYRKNGMA